MHLKALCKFRRLRSGLLTKTLRVVKLTAIIFLAACLQVSAMGYSQTVTLSRTNVSLDYVFQEIQKQTGYNFLYTYEELERVGPIDVDLRNVSLREAMDRCLSGKPLSYAIVERSVIIKHKIPAVDLPAVVSTPPPIDIHGRVTDSLGNPLAGASVTVKGAKKGTSTDASGNFELKEVDNNVTLLISFTGFESREIKLRGKNELSIQMKQSVSSLQDVVVVAYGTQRKVNLTGSVASVNSAQLEDRPVTGVANALEGAMAGVTIVSNNGQPGKDTGTINIRGKGTLNNTAPMIVIDGIIATPTDMNSLNADDIDNISVLKDAASSSIYGSRAANGVMLITTKKGKKGTSQVTYSAYMGKQSATALPNYLPSWQAATLYNQARINEGATAVYSTADIDSFKNGLDRVNYPNTDWLGLFYNGSGFQQNHYIGVSAGTDKTQYHFSLGYFDQDGIVKKTNTQRYTARFNLTSRVSSRLTVNANLAYTYQPLQEPRSSLPADPSFNQMIRQINRISPIIPYQYANGEYGHISDGNPMAWLNSPSYNKQHAYTLLGMANADLEIVKGLHFIPSLAYKSVQNQNKSFISSIQYYNADGTVSGSANTNSSTDHYDNTYVITPQAILDYSQKINEHTFRVLAGYSQEYTNYYLLEGYRQNFLNNSLSDLNVAPTTGETSSGDSYERTLKSYFGRANYDYKGKYLVEGNLRADASSIFAPANRWGYFPSASAAWRLSEESFFSRLRSTVSNLKIRGSWGRLGNQNIGANYPYIPTVSSGQNYSFGGVVVGGVSPVNGANVDIKWETTTETDLGLDVDLLHNKLNFTADYFIKNTNGILYALPVGATYGLTAPTQNTASVRNKGLELTLGYHDKKGDFSYGATANASFISNKVTDLGPSSSPVISAATIVKVGLPINGFWGYQSQGIFQTQAQIDAHPSQTAVGGRVPAPGDLIYKDINGPDGKPDGIIDANDKTYLGANFPKITFGLNLTAAWKEFDIVGFFQGAAGVTNIISGPILGQIGNTVGKPTSAWLDNWTPANTGASMPRLFINYKQNDPGQTPSSFWVKNASYLRMKNLQIGYTLPQKWAQAAHIQRLRVYYSAQNLFTITSFYKWVDPEAPSNTIGSSYPQVKMNTVGLNLTF